jgi:hypothetical protein
MHNMRFSFIRAFTFRNMIISLSDLPELALEGVLKYLPFGSIKNMRLVNRK